MPLVRIELLQGRSGAEIEAIGGAVQRALVDCLGVPERDRFQIITEHTPGRLVYNPSYLGVPRSDGFVFIEVLLSAGRTTDQKTAFYARVASLLAEAAQVRPEDVAIALVENVRRTGRSETGWLSTSCFPGRSGSSSALVRAPIMRSGAPRLPGLAGQADGKGGPLRWP